MAIWNFDHIVLAVHSDASAGLLPYKTEYDADCWWTSQWTLNLLAGALFRNHVLMIPAVNVLNEKHSTPPACTEHLQQASARARETVHADVRSCFPDPQPSVIQLPTGQQKSQYLPWGTAQKRRSAATQYSTVSMGNISPCDDEVALKALQQESSFSWCVGCDTLFALQSMIAARVVYAPNWNTLGFFLLECDIMDALLGNHMAEVRGCARHPDA